MRTSGNVPPRFPLPKTLSSAGSKTAPREGHIEDWLCHEPSVSKKDLQRNFTSGMPWHCWSVCTVLQDGHKSRFQAKNEQEISIYPGSLLQK